MVIGKEKGLSSAVEIQIFRIASELINDILKNSGVDEVILAIESHVANKKYYDPKLSINKPADLVKFAIKNGL